MAIEFLDPTHENAFGGFELAPRLASLQGAVIAIVSNGKRGTIPFFDALEGAFKTQFAVGEVVRITKGNYSTPVEAERLNDAERWQALVSGVGD
ncbi:MAG: hypothetical protein AAF384_12050 [Pseudomonadota bacterium]